MSFLNLFVLLLNLVQDVVDVKVNLVKIISFGNIEAQVTNNIIHVEVEYS